MLQWLAELSLYEVSTAKASIQTERNAEMAGDC